MKVARLAITILAFTAFIVTQQPSVAQQPAPVTQTKPAPPSRRAASFLNRPEAYPEPLNSQLKQIQDQALASDYAYRELAHLCNNIGPRLSGSPQAAQAVQYVAEEMRKLGAEVTLEKVM